MNSNRPLLSKLLLRLVHLANKVDESLTRLRHTLLGPVGELELPDCAGLPVPSIRHFELSQNVLRHVVLGNRLNNVVKVAR